MAKQVLVVDDDDASAESVAALMMSIGLDAETYDTAERFLNEFDGRPDACLVLDVRLPGMSGLQLQRALESRNLAIPIVMISGHADHDESREALGRGAIAFLEKPYTADEFCQKVKAALSLGMSSAS